MRFENCIFDLYGTLVDIRTDESAPALWAAMAAYYRARGAVYRPAELHRAYLAAVRRLERAAAPAGGGYGEIRIERVFQALFAQKGVRASWSQAAAAGRRFRRLSTVYIRLYDGARELLQALRAGGQGVWLLSNAQAVFTRGELEALGIGTLFDGVYLSSDCGVKKPDRRFFDALLRQQAIRPESAVMVGNDGLCDVLGARAAGLATVYIRSNISPAEPLPPADYVFGQMDLPGVTALLTGER